MSWPNAFPPAADLTDRLDAYLAATAHLREATWARGEDDRPGAFRVDFATLTPEERIAATVALLDLMNRSWYSVKPLLKQCVRGLVFEDPDDLRLVVALASGPHHGEEVADRLGVLLPAIRATGAQDPPWFDATLRQLVEMLDGRTELEGQKVVQRRGELVALLAGEPELALVVRGDDGWATEVRSRLEREPPDRRQAAVRLLAQLESVPSGPRPTTAWRQATSAVLDQTQGAATLVHDLLELVLSTSPVERHVRLGEHIHTSQVFLRESSQLQVKGAVWAAAGTGEPWVADTLAEVAITVAGWIRLRPEVQKVTNAAVAALAELPTDDAIRALGRVEARVKHKGVRTQVQRALAAAAEAAGITPAQLIERSVPRLGLDADARRVQPIGGFDAVLAVTDTGEATLSFVDPEGAISTKVPPRLKADHPRELRALKKAHKEAKDAIAAERRRLEGLLASDRSWSAADWHRLYLDHPITGALARRLIWTVTDGGGTRAILPALDAPDATEGLDDHATVGLWHPCEVPADEVRAWRARVLAAELRQPFKQAFREVYLLTPAEEATRTYSNRFAAHVVRAQQLTALVRAREWSMTALGSWDGGFDATATRDLPDHGLRAQFFVEVIEDGGMDHLSGLATLAGTDQVRFVRLDDPPAGPLPLTDVPPRVLSEVLRDVDLFVSVPSIGMDPNWLDGGEDRHREYWNTVAFGELGPTATTRREILTDLLPRLRIADRCTLEERFLVVRGDRRTYRIHLGSGHVRMEPDDQYLCIVPARTATPGKVFLPFDDDRTLSVILSKAFLLADDRKITDATILLQLERGERNRTDGQE